MLKFSSLFLGDIDFQELIIVIITTFKIGWCDIFSNFQLKLIVTFEIFIYHQLSILSVN